ncbi:hypothetical protein A3A76_02595 [Candidatus Woesebacteria bacterium RIFCSPLOWO2_01_FULL_39_23]|uniref:Uncharacterized protein n=1 Tax=Candidatus Woesebacteria bacterium RIFCSPHIGHO2_01_FULL_40_22 TaxID=1802499 RepID=A0A1F7YLG7_9BACT|nr:MAG: hypothetical protein A2141_01435 [Candidatus Woesebacteria bacterium RBG_16_40_11]OGM27365.1 MAG: hypothetical protein A2628_01000 [Candidatus Woesebacteria bacterium RIFCSPHIGHO2_01_FULL_40_22]OGM37256.1 MAG: hypothetical protein A3E41_00210 [Candidatus Woesebacteria bacterium RIFCSPHIGHO2_12_FULL_38_9]OGM62537.1 MAG: hypothetical protein A3A76_02595 [Candidatus Woesebacteria bacterium RIFCSPLOWO2_01_FULL_39_23]
MSTREHNLGKLKEPIKRPMTRREFIRAAFGVAGGLVAAKTGADLLINYVVKKDEVVATGEGQNSDVSGGENMPSSTDVLQGNPANTPIGPSDKLPLGTQVVTDVPPSLTPTTQPSPAQTEAPVPTDYSPIPEVLNDKVQDKVIELKKKGVDIHIKVDDVGDAHMSINMGKNNRLEWGLIKVDTTPEKENNVFITTAKNEPVSFNFESFGVDNGDLVIKDKEGLYGAKGKVLLKFHEGNWVADRLLFLAAGPKPRICDNGLPTGGADNLLTGVLISSTAVGFYDKGGYLHNVNHLGIEDKFGVVGLCKKEASGGGKCRIVKPEVAQAALVEWDRNKIGRQIGLDVFVNRNEETKELADAIKSGENFPELSPDYSLPINTLYEWSPQ